MTSPWVAMGTVLGLLGIAIGVLWWWQRTYSPEPEAPRKILHIVMGLITLSLPWLFDEVWPVLVLSALAFLSLLSVRLVRGLSSGPGRVLHSVDRQSYGELVFPIGIAVVFVLAEGNTALYVVPVLMLTLADAVAAVIGIRYGRKLYSAPERPKSIEGSFAFFIVAFLSALIPLLLLTTVGRVEVLLISVMLGLLVMIVEAISWSGLDNLFVPMGAWVFLNANIDEPVSDLVVVVTGLIVLVVFGLWFRGRTTLNDSAVLGAALAGWTFWALGGTLWLIGPAALFISYALIPPLSGTERQRVHDTRIVLAYVLPGLVWTFWASSADLPELLFPFSVTFAALSAMNGTVRWKKCRPDLPAWLAIGRGSGFAILAILVPWAILEGVSVATLAPMLLAAVLAALAATIMWGIRTRMDETSMPARRWAYESIIAFAASLIAFLFMKAVI